MNRILFGLIIINLLILSSCAGKKIVYVKDMIPDSTYIIQDIPELRVQKGDRLSIIVQSKAPELAAPFNSIYGAYRVNADGNISTTATDQTSETAGYLVDKNGLIYFPILGSLKLNNLTLDQVRELIYDRLVKEQLVNDPLVKVDLINFKITVTGSVNSQIVLNVPNGRLTLLEALTKAGGLRPNSASDRVTVIREDNGERTKIVTDIESKDVFKSPAYYLQQNDVVYVEPESIEFTVREERNYRYFSTLLGVITLVVTILSLSK